MDLPHIVGLRPSSVVYHFGLLWSVPARLSREVVMV
jgi:hypothetical protein